MRTDYAITRTLADAAYEPTVARVRELLAGEGFGVLTEIDVRATMRSKLGLDVRPYLILGACNPGLAHRALSAEPMVGVLLPCNVVVMAGDDGGTVVAAFNPTAGFRMLDNPAMEPIAAEVEQRLRRVLDAL